MPKIFFINLQHFELSHFSTISYIKMMVDSKYFVKSTSLRDFSELSF